MDQRLPNVFLWSNINTISSSSDSEQIKPICEVHLPEGGCIWTVVNRTKSLGFSDAVSACQEKNSVVANIHRNYTRESALAILRGKIPTDESSVTAWFNESSSENVSEHIIC